MKPRVALTLIGALPLIVGLITTRPERHEWIFMFRPGWLWFIGLITLVIWFVAGFLSVRWVDSKRDVLIHINAVAGLVLAFVLVQELMWSNYWRLGWTGILAQFFYLPLAHVLSLHRLLRVLPLEYVRLWHICTILFFIYFLTSFLGRKIGAYGA